MIAGLCYLFLDYWCTLKLNMCASWHLNINGKNLLTIMNTVIDFRLVVSWYCINTQCRFIWDVIHYQIKCICKIASENKTTWDMLKYRSKSEVWLLTQHVFCSMFISQFKALNPFLLSGYPILYYIFVFQVHYYFKYCSLFCSEGMTQTISAKTTNEFISGQQKGHGYPVAC